MPLVDFCRSDFQAAVSYIILLGYSVICLSHPILFSLDNMFPLLYRIVQAPAVTNMYMRQRALEREFSISRFSKHADFRRSNPTDASMW